MSFPLSRGGVWRWRRRCERHVVVSDYATPQCMSVAGGVGGETADEALAVLLDGAEDELLLHVAQLIDRY